MWTKWEKEQKSNTDIAYTYLVSIDTGNSKTVVELTAMIYQLSSQEWKVLITAFHSSTGEYTDFEDTFASFDEANAKAWEEAQIALQSRIQRGQKYEITNQGVQVKKTSRER